MLNADLHAAKRRLQKEIRQRHGGRETADAACLGDNCYLLLGALGGALAAVKRRPRRFARVWELCGAFAHTGLPATEEAVVSFFSGKGLSLTEAAALGTLLSAAYAVKAANAYGKAPDDEDGARPFPRAVSSLQRLRDADFEALTPQICAAERALTADAGYRRSDAETKARYRRAVTRLAEKTGETEEKTVLAALKYGGHVGFSLPVAAPPRGGAAFLAAEALTALALDLCCTLITLRFTEGIWRTPIAGVLFALTLFLPLLHAVRPPTDRLASLLYKPRFLPSLDPENPEVRLPKTLIAVSALVPAAENAAAFAAHLESVFRANRSENAFVLALLDLKNADVPIRPSDGSDIAAVKREIARLNLQYGGGFLLAVRDRVYSTGEREYTGYERKRGAVEALVRLLTDGDAPFGTLSGDLAGLTDVEYLLALDADTEAPFGELRKLLAAAAHPMNRAVLNARGDTLISGYGCFAPRTEVSAAAAAKTRFTSIMTRGGVTAYAPRVSSRHMDLFGASVFCGKGLIDVRAYRALCADAFPPGRVLSHDILEGGLLKTAFVSGAVFTEGFPASPRAYFRRQERWVRGDTQNLRFVFRALSGGRRLPALTKYQLLDNVGRALLPVCCCVLLLGSVGLPAVPALLFFAAALTGRCAGPLFSALEILRAEGAFGFSRVYFSDCLSAGLQALARTLLAAAFLPYEAAVNAAAVCRALWRSLTGRRTLEWTTAADAERGGRAPLLPAVIWPFTAALLLTFGRGWHLVPAALILLFMPFAISDGRKKPTRRVHLTGGETETLLQYAAAMWRFFAENAGPEDHYLPPDHVQETPVRQTAHRTSPTNIGLYLLSVLAAADLALISPAELCDRLAESLGTLTRLERCGGLLYNWYDTRTLSPLSPAFVSSVDCGNYLVCLTALKEGLKEYLPLGGGFAALIGWIETELSSAAIETLFSRRRKLFSVGKSLPDGTLADSYYDCYMSEARLTSYYAVAKGLVPVSHWSVPDRPFLRSGRAAPAASYGGTAFEYLMPALFLPTYENTYAREGLLACCAAQRRRVKGTAMPWGVSESAYYAFDERLGYCYRAHGLKALALKRDPSDEPVFAPYACFLALPLQPKTALKNLRRFAALGAYGAYGFYEAVDFSERARPEDYMIVRSFMAHHVGMSLLAAVNALRGDLFVKRFLRDPFMDGAKGLLAERIPTGAPVRRPPSLPAVKTPPRPRTAAPAPTDAALYSNGEISLICDEAGRNYVFAGRRSLFAFSSRAAGVSAAVRVSGKILVPAAGQRSLTRTAFYARMQEADLTAETALALVGRFSSLAVPVKLRNRARTPRTAELIWYFEPGFDPPLQPSEHPAFSDMGVRIAYEKGLSALTVRRVERNETPLWLAVGFADASPFTFACDRERLLGFGERGTPFENMPQVFTNDLTFTSPAVAVKTAVTLPGNGKTEKVLLVCPAASRAAALETLARMRHTRLPDLRRAVGSPVPAAAAPYAARFLSTVFFGRRDPEISAAAAQNNAPVSALWEQGISGDLPVIRVQTDGLPAPAVETFTALYRALTFAGIPCDLVLLTLRSQGYGSPAVRALTACAEKAGLGGRLGKNGGVHVLTVDACSKAFLSALSAAPGLTFPFVSPVPPPEAAILPAPSLPLFGGRNGFVPNGYYIAEKPPRPWSHTLSNPVFGTLLTWGSLGYTWALDARLNRLTPWENDLCTPMRGERLELTVGARTYDAVFGASVYFWDDGALFGSVSGGVKLRVTVQVDAKAAKKRVRVQFSESPGAVLRYRLTPLLAESDKCVPYVHGKAENGALTFYNPACTDSPGFLRLTCDPPAEASCENGAGTLTAPLPAGDGELVFTLLWAVKETALDALQALPFRPQKPARRTLSHENAAVSRFGSALLLHCAHDTRVLARTGIYQNSGAFGFRDQLQDTMNLCEIHPARAKIQLLRCAAAQFPAGDALHWFRTVLNPRPHLRGVRTRCADDALWLPLAAARYLQVTGDTALLELPVPYLEGAPLANDEQERHGDYYAGKIKRCFYVHCAAAVKNALRFGPHGLPLMRGGDWNDAFGQVGREGRGESVWLGMFLALTCERFAAVAAAYRDAETANALRVLAADQRDKLARAAFNGTYFLRGFYDDGAPLGDRGADACAIDLLPQAFAVFADVGTPEQRKSALNAAFDALWDDRHKLLRLFAPPFTEHTRRAGYVNDYPAGVRENAGQYTHAAVWFYMALKKEGLDEKAAALLPALIPALRCEDPAIAARFGNEPYLPAADIAAAPGPAGRGGWSGYTGAAGWLWRALTGGAF